MDLDIVEIPVAGYERVAMARHARTGLRACIAVHSTVLGPAVGGIRMWPYETEEQALTDVLRLAEGMTFKSAVAETGLGGGKAVIMGDSRTAKTPELLQAMGRFVHDFQGRYVPAEDVGTTVADLVEVARTTRWVSGLPRDQGGSGNPSPFTALGVFYGIEACMQDVLGDRSLAGRVVAIQGLGSVGFALAGHLHEAGARLVVDDLDPARVRQAVADFGAVAAPRGTIHRTECDVFAPCALGAGLNDQTIPELRCRIVAGAANNQLGEPRHGRMLLDRGITYAPDFVINSGGIINVGLEFAPGGYDEEQAWARVQRVFRAVKETLALARALHMPTSEAAVRLARNKLDAAMVR
jgi:leucine dehydrogenase